MFRATCRPASGHQCWRNAGLIRVPPKAAMLPKIIGWVVGEVERCCEVDRRQGGDRNGLHRDRIALEDVKRDCPESEGQPVEIVVPEAQQIGRRRQAAIERGAEQDQEDKQGARQRRRIAPADVAQ